jgi:opacity protein-like surface antigen
MRTIIGRLCIAAMALVAGPALAQSWYVGASYASTRGEVDSGQINGDLAGLGFKSASVTSDVTGSGGRAFVGYSFLPWLDAELYYADLGKISWNATVTPPGTLSASIKSSAWGLAALANFSPMDKVKLFGKLGVARTEAKASFSSGGFVELASSGKTESNTSFVYGVGAAWEFMPNLSLRLDYDIHDNVGSDSIGGSYNVQSLALGVSFRF